METAKQERAPGRPSAVDQAQAAARVKPPSTLGNVASFLYTNVLTYLLPKQKTLVRAILFAILALLPFLLIVFVKLPHIMIPFFLVVGGTVYALGGGEDIAKQFRWMKRMSGRGPIFWFLEWAHRQSVRVARKLYGSKLDVLPLAPKALGTETRGALKAKLKWISTPSSSYSTERCSAHSYSISQTRTTIARVVKLADDLGQPRLLNHCGWHRIRRASVRSTRAATRVASTPSQPRTARPLGRRRARGGGQGHVGAAPERREHCADRRPAARLDARQQLDVKVLPTTLEVRHNDVAVVVVSCSAQYSRRRSRGACRRLSGGSGGKAGSDGAARELHITLLKGGKPSEPFWPQLIKATRRSISRL